MVATITVETTIKSITNMVVIMIMVKVVISGANGGRMDMENINMVDGMERNMDTTNTVEKEKKEVI